MTAFACAVSRDTGLIIPPGMYDYEGLFLDHSPSPASSSILSPMADLPQALLAFILIEYICKVCIKSKSKNI